MRTIPAAASVRGLQRTLETGLLSRYRGVICDLDGVVYRGSLAVPGAVETLNAVFDASVPVVFATNNASRTPSAVENHLLQLGLETEGWSVATSAQAAATYLAERLRPAMPVLAVGGPGVAHALSEAGLTPVRTNGSPHRAEVAAVVQGAGPDVCLRDLAEAAYLVQGGAIWVATNLDATVPTSRGQSPGNGALVAAVQMTTSAEPHVCGKPAPDLFELARARMGCDRSSTIVVGDRLDTDIVGARNAGLASMLVLGGASSLKDLAFAEEASRPTNFAWDLRGLLEPGLCGLPELDDIVVVTPEGIPVIRHEAPLGQLIQAIVTAAWHARDAARALSADAATWADIEVRLGRLRAREPSVRANSGPSS